MSKKSIIARNVKRQRMVERYAAKREALKADGDSMGLQRLPRNSSPNRVVNRCSVTGRPRAVYRKFGVCRNVFRSLALDGKIPGIRKASW